jgi:proton-dependent oligopeptide transporter, POT family
MLTAILKQPKAVFLLAFVQLWNRFSHYGMRALLLLYMIKVLKTPDPVAIGIFAVYCALVELGGVFGAYLAEKFLGLRRAVMLGGWLIGIGHLLLALEWNLSAALGFVILGSCLYTTNVATLLGDFYPPGDKRRQQGFTLFYMSINIGGFLATLLCAYVAEKFGWHLGFGLAAIGMVIANLTLLFLRSHLLGKGEPPCSVSKARKVSLVPMLALGLGLSILALHMQQIACPLLPWIGGALLVFIFGGLIVKKKMTRQLLKSVMISIGGLILFFAAGEQMGTSLLLFADKVNSTDFSAMSLLAINPLVIILGGAAAHAILNRVKSPAWRLFIPFALAAVAFGSMFVGIPLLRDHPLLLVGGVIGLISFAEVMIGPATYSQCSEAATLHQDPKVMALMPIGFAMAASLGGIYSQSLAGEAFDPHHYQMGFGILALGLLGVGALIGLAKSQKQRNFEFNY